MDKLVAAHRAAIDVEGAGFAPAADNLVRRVRLPTLEGDVAAHMCAGGFFLEYADASLDALGAVATRAYQTVTTIGIDPQSVAAELVRIGARGVDRIVPCGRAAAFGAFWDGYDLISQMSRHIHVE